MSGLLIRPADVKAIYDQLFLRKKWSPFRIANFERRQKEARRFLLSDDVDFRIRNQHWVLSNGDSIDFSNLHFSGRDQHFEIDSCLLKTADKESGNSVEIRASKFFFTSSRLTSAYLEGK